MTISLTKCWVNDMKTLLSREDSKVDAMQDVPFVNSGAIKSLDAIARSMQKYPNATCANCGAIIPEGSPSIFCRICNEE